MKSSPDLDSAARESQIFARLQAWDKAILSRTEIGILCREVRDTPLWQCRCERLNRGCLWRPPERGLRPTSISERSQSYKTSQTST